MSKKRPFKPRPTGSHKSKLKKPLKSAATVSYGTVKSFDGTEIFYSVEGTGKPMVFCYGLICSSLHWTYQIDYFRDTHQAIWFDYRGHHNSQNPDDVKSLTIENCARDLLAVLDELKIKDAVILGHSLGVNVALEFYRQNPERVAGLVLANGTAKRPFEMIMNMNVRAAIPLIRAAFDKAPGIFSSLWKFQKGNQLVRTVLGMTGFNPHLSHKSDIRRYADDLADIPMDVFLRLCEDFDPYDATDWLHEVKVPTLVIAGDQDVITPMSQQEHIHQHIKGSSLEVINHGSHFSQMDLPDLINLKVEKFLSTFQYGEDRRKRVPKKTAIVD